MDPPWSMSIHDEAPLTLICQTHGARPSSARAAEPSGWGPGDVALARGIEHYVFADDPATTPMVVIHPGQRCTTLSRRRPAVRDVHRGAHWGNSMTGSTEVGDLRLRGPQRGQRPAARRAADRAGAARRRMGHPAGRSARTEAGFDGPGQEAYLDRLLDLLLIAVVRTWFDRAGNAPTWWHAEQDPMVGPALKLIYNNPGPPVDGGESGCGRWAVRGRCSRAGSPSRWVNRPSHSSPAGGSPWPPTCCGRARPPSPRWPARSATAPRSR